MELVRGQHNLRAEHSGCALCIGNFDGVHLGHQVLLAALFEQAAQFSAPSMVMLFEPLPSEYFNADGAPARLSSLREKLGDLQRMGVQRVLCQRFDAAFAALSPLAFIDDLLHAKLGAKAVIVGRDFRFGAGRGGDFNLLEKRGRELGMKVLCVDDLCRDGERVSSTRIRASLAAGEVAQAKLLLGRGYSISGRVRHGKQLGRELGMPTLNLALNRKPAPRLGVYAVRVHGLGARALPGVANLGLRPTVDTSTDVRESVLEVHLFDTSGDFYGRRVNVEFECFLRPEQKFNSLELLAKQMHADARRARAFFMQP